MRHFLRFVAMKLDLIPRIKELYEKGVNVMEYLRSKDGRNHNTVEDILISYDFQAGSYIKYVERHKQGHFEYTAEIASVLIKLGIKTAIEVGCGEATVLGHVAQRMPGVRFSGFDISWSRVRCGFDYLKKMHIVADLFVADLFSIPLGDNAIDVVYTSHSIEPNGGREKEAIQELYRVASKYVVLLEPTAEFATGSGKERMKKNGYVQNLRGTIEELGYNLIEYRYFGVSVNPANPTGLYVIKKDQPTKSREYACPVTKGDLMEFIDHFYSPDLHVSYPKILGIPCLMPDYGVLTARR